MEKIEIDKKIASHVYKNITPLKFQRKRIKKLYGEIKSFLGVNNCFQTGSYARHTSIRPVNDLDIFYILDEPSSDDEISDFLRNLEEDINKNFKENCSEKFSTRIQTHSVKLEFDDGFSIDLVPAVNTGITTNDLNTIVYKVPVESTGDWVYSDPKGYRVVTKQTDENSERRFRRAVRFIKACRKSCKEVDDDFKLKSFHVEQILTESFTLNPDLLLVDSIKEFFEDVSANMINSRFVDRADNSVYIDSYVDDLNLNQRDKIVNWSKTKLSQFSELEFANEDDVEKLLNKVISCSKEDLESKESIVSYQSNSFSPAGPHAIF